MQAGSIIMVVAINKSINEAGFLPISDEKAHTLILGSMPSASSLEKQQYYAHPRNAFWTIMSALFNLKQNEYYHQRCAHLIAHNIAVWDVLKSCQRQGSLDQNINTDRMIINNFNAFFVQHPNIKKIYFNGGKAEQIFKQRVLPNLKRSFQQIHQQRLPSTSPAYAAITLEKKIDLWYQLLTTE